MPVEVLIGLLIKISIMIFFGYILRKCSVITDELEKGLSSLLLNGVLPLSVISSATMEYTSDKAKQIGLMAVISLGYYVVAIVSSMGIRKKLKLSRAGKNVFVTMSVFANVGFMGFPIMSELYGDTGLLLAVVYNIFYQIFFFSFGVSILNGEGKVAMGLLIKNPATIACCLSVVLFLTRYRLPEPVQNAFSSIGDMMVPLSMLIIGCSLVGMDVKSLLNDRNSTLVSFMRLLVYPLIMMVVLFLLKLPEVVVVVGTLLTAMPCGSLNLIMAKEYNCEPEYAARAVVQSMVLSIIMIPITILVLNLVI